jgi:hypothetical protein
MGKWVTAIAVLASFLSVGCEAPEQTSPKPQSQGQAEATNAATAVPSAVASPGAQQPAAEAADTAPAVKPPLTPKPGTLLLVKDFERKPLGTEQAHVDKFVAFLNRGEGPTLEQSDRTEQVETYLQEYHKQAQDSASLPDLPHAWGAFETVLVVSMRSPAGEPGKHTSGGLKGLHLFTPPSKVPAYSVLYEGSGSAGLDGESLASWVLEDYKNRKAQTGALQAGTTNVGALKQEKRP